MITSEAIQIEISGSTEYAVDCVGSLLQEADIYREIPQEVNSFIEIITSGPVYQDTVDGAVYSGLEIIIQDRIDELPEQIKQARAEKTEQVRSLEQDLIRHRLMEAALEGAQKSVKMDDGIRYNNAKFVNEAIIAAGSRIDAPFATYNYKAFKKAMLKDAATEAEIRKSLAADSLVTHCSLSRKEATEILDELSKNVKERIKIKAQSVAQNYYSGMIKSITEEKIEKASKLKAYMPYTKSFNFTGKDKKVLADKFFWRDAVTKRASDHTAEVNASSYMASAAGGGGPSHAERIRAEQKSPDDKSRSR